MVATFEGEEKGDGGDYAFKRLLFENNCAPLIRRPSSDGGKVIRPTAIIRPVSATAIMVNKL